LAWPVDFLGISTSRFNISSRRAVSNAKSKQSAPEFPGLHGPFGPTKGAAHPPFCAKQARNRRRRCFWERFPAGGALETGRDSGEARGWGERGKPQVKRPAKDGLINNLAVGACISVSHSYFAPPIHGSRLFH
jgi:hypothetical protein